MKVRIEVLACRVRGGYEPLKLVVDVDQMPTDDEIYKIASRVVFSDPVEAAKTLGIAPIDWGPVDIVHLGWDEFASRFRPVTNPFTGSCWYGDGTEDREFAGIFRKLQKWSECDGKVISGWFPTGRHLLTAVCADPGTPYEVEAPHG